MTDDIQNLLPDMEQLDQLMPQMVALMPPMIETMKTMRTMMLTMYATQKGMQDQMAAMQENSTAMGEAFDASKNDDSFYLPPEVFDNADFKRGMKNFISPDGKSVRFIISHEGDPATPEGIAKIDAIKQAAKEAIKGTPLEGSKIYLAGTAATYKDMQDGSELRPADRRNLRAVPDLHHHADHHAQRGGRRGHRRHGGAVARRVVRALRADLAAHPRHRTALDGAGDVGHHPAGGGLRLQPAAGVPVQGGDPRRHQHRASSARWAAPDRWSPSAGLVFAFTMMSMVVSELAVIGQVGTHHRAGPAVRHAGGPVVHDAVDRRAAGQMVLVAATSAGQARPVPVAQTRAASDGVDGRGVPMKRTLFGSALVAAGLVLAAPAHADVDTDFAHELHNYGIYGQKDYNAWIGKIVCKRLRNDVDNDAYTSAQFVHLNLHKDATTEQAWQFLGAALRTYCPDKLPILQAAAAQQ